MLKPVDIENAEISKASWTNMGKLNENTINEFEDVCQCSQNNNELPSIPPDSSFQPKTSHHNRQSLILGDAQVPQESQDKLFLAVTKQI